jgi:hypothetical protein
VTIQIVNPDVEALIDLHLRSGFFKNAEDVILHALRTSAPPAPPANERSLAEVFAAARGLGDDLDITRNPSHSRFVELS